MIRRFAGTMMITFLVIGCASTDPNKRAKEGAAVGAAAGAVAGAIVGNQSGNNQTGAVVGAVVGAGVGAAIGHRMDKEQQELQRINGVDVTRTADNELNVVLRNDVLFDVDSAALRTESRTTLRDLASVLGRYTDTSISVEGYTDSTGTTAHNQDLSERRAGSVKNYLVDQGVPSRQMDARGYGESRPKASNDTAEGRQLNRRVEIHVRANS